MLAALGVVIPEVLDRFFDINFAEPVWWRVGYSKLQASNYNINSSCFLICCCICDKQFLLYNHCWVWDNVNFRFCSVSSRCPVCFSGTEEITEGQPPQLFGVCLFTTLILLTIFQINKDTIYSLELKAKL